MKKTHCKGEFKKFSKKMGYELLLVKKDVITSSYIREKCRGNTSNYGKNYACPPFAPTVDQFNHENILVYLLYVHGRGMDEWELLAKLIFEYGKKLEPRLDGICFIAGPCKLCKSCKAEVGEPCPYPKEMRYSFTAVGLDAEKLNRFLEQKVLWDSMYTSAVGGCLTKQKEIDLKKLSTLLIELNF